MFLYNLLYNALLDQVKLRFFTARHGFNALVIFAALVAILSSFKKRFNFEHIKVSDVVQSYAYIFENIIDALGGQLVIVETIYSLVLFSFATLLFFLLYGILRLVLMFSSKSTACFTNAWTLSAFLGLICMLGLAYLLPNRIKFQSELLMFVGLFLPAISGTITLLFGRLLGRFGTFTITLFSGLCVTAVAWYNFFCMTSSASFYFGYTRACWTADSSAWYWIGKNLDWTISVDYLTITMWSLITIVALLVILFSFNYMLLDPHLPRFLSYLSLFTFFMLLLVSSDSLVQFFFAWEGVGICSYLLIGFWSTRLQAVKAAIKAVLVNKVGDVFLLFAVSLLWSYFGIYEFSQIDKTLSLNVAEPFCFYFADDQTPAASGVITAIAICFVFAAVGKSAQLGLHTWLPDAMEGPTPVSALIHAATMVTAGIFLMLRVHFLLSVAPSTLSAVAVIGALTAFSAGLIACYQLDIKKIIAYSTCSQLGYMFFACGLTLYSASIFHLISHGFFKALLFLAAGSLIHLARDEQFLIKLSLHESRKLTHLYSASLYIGLVALSALPFFSGFYSKEPILLHSGAVFFKRVWVSEISGYSIGVLASVLTATYSSALLNRILYSNPYHRRSGLRALFTPASTVVALSLLLLFSAMFGYGFESTVLVIFGDYFEDAVWCAYYHNSLLVRTKLSAFSDPNPALPLVWELLPVLGVAFVAMTPTLKSSALFFKNPIVYSKYSLTKNQTDWLSIVSAEWRIFQKVGDIFSNKFWVDFFYNTVFVWALSLTYRRLFKELDKGLLEFWGTHNNANLVNATASSISRLHQNMIIEGFFLMTAFLLFNLIVIY